MASRVSLRYSLAMFPICAGLSYFHVVDNAFMATSSVVNAWMLREAFKFWRLQGERGSARALFWASVWQLPIVLVLAMVHKKGAVGETVEEYFLVSRSWKRCGMKMSIESSECSVNVNSYAVRSVLSCDG